ncbi:MAG: signal peptidase II [Deltaproteobacteria bacterium]|nr:signal peptidase II [Deltaproteobacteria bacterium]
MKEKLKTVGALIVPIFILDQLTKQWVAHSLGLGEGISIIPGLFDIIHVRNRGAAFGFMSHLPDKIRLPFFFVVSALALVLITVYFLKIEDQRKSFMICLGLILGGAMGNISDRIFFGEVIDFLSFHWYDKVIQIQAFGFQYPLRLEWPAFNVADSAITVSVVWLMIVMFQPSQKH